MDQPTHPSPQFSRRSALRGVGGLAAAASLGLAGPAQARRTSSASASALSRVDRVFIQRGLRHGAWSEVPEQGKWRPDSAYFQSSGFTDPTWYDAPLWDAELMGGLPSSSAWSATKGPKGYHIDGSTPVPNPILSDQQRPHADRLFTFCMGDEEGYSDALVEVLRNLFAQMRTEAPNALLHTNQWNGGWSSDQLKHYMWVCQPDLLTFDDYYFSMNSSYPGGSVTGLYNGIAFIRWIAMGGLDQTFTSPIAYGQYTMGFKSGGSPYAEGGDYVVSESEQSIVLYVTWTVGGKWNDLFRWEKDSHPTSLLVHKDDSSSPTEQFRRYQTLNRHRANLSPYLSRVHSKEVQIVMGQNEYGYNSQPWYDIFSATRDADLYLNSVSAQNVGGANGGRPGDILIGSFRPIPNMNAEEAGWFTDPQTPVFMVTNAMAVRNNDYTNEFGTGGSSADTAQRVTLQFNLSGARHTPNQLVYVNPDTGELVRPTLTNVGTNLYEFAVTIPGGRGLLFMWAPN